MRFRMLAQGFGVAAVLLLAQLTLPAAYAAPRPMPSLELEPPHLNEQGDAIVLSALLSDTAGEPISGERVTFLVEVAFEAVEPMVIGSRATDATGHATVTYLPTWDGEHQLTAQFGGNATYLAATTNWLMEVEGAGLPYVEEPRGLESVRRWLPITVGTVVFVVWASLAWITAWTVIGIVRQGSGEPALE